MRVCYKGKLYRIRVILCGICGFVVGLLKPKVCGVRMTLYGTCEFDKKLKCVDLEFKQAREKEKLKFLFLRQDLIQGEI